MNARTDGDDERRQTCLWLAELASLRPEVVPRLVRAFGTFPQVLEQSREEIAAALPRPRPEARCRDDEGAGEEPTESNRETLVRGAGGRPARGAAALPSVTDGAAWRAAIARRAPLVSQWVTESGIVVAYTDALYPSRLRALEDPPPALCVLGAGGAAAAVDRLEAVDRSPCVAVVGTRRPSPYGLEMAQGISGDLVADGAVVVSGLALGIDAAAHRGALDAAVPGAGADHAASNVNGEAQDGETAPVTVAVVGCGADVCYPPAHRSLRERVLAGGLVVSEFAWGTPARAWRFPARNRVMAALSDAVVVVEGPAGSGALITARCARQLGRVVLAVPGESGRRLTEGPHALLREGAVLCESGACVRRAFAPADKGAAADEGASGEEAGPANGAEPAGEDGPAVAGTVVTSWLAACESRTASGTRGRGLAPDMGALLPAEATVLAAVDSAERELDGLVASTGLPPATVLCALGALEVRGLVAPSGGGRYRAVRGRGMRAV